MLKQTILLVAFICLETNPGYAEELGALKAPATSETISPKNLQTGMNPLDQPESTIFSETEKVLKLISQGEVTGYQQLRPLMVRNPSQENWERAGKRILGEMEKFLLAHGKFHGLDFVTQKQIGQSFLQKTYIAKYEHGAFRWVITYYKPDDLWRVYHVHFDTKVLKLFE